MLLYNRATRTLALLAFVIVLYPHLNSINETACKADGCCKFCLFTSLCSVLCAIFIPVNASSSNSAFWYDSLAQSRKLHFSNTGLKRLLGSKPNFCACFSVIGNSPTQLLICLGRPLFVPVVCSIKKRLFWD